MKKLDFKVLSDEKCDTRGCERRIKANVARRISRRPLTCYGCHVATKPRGRR